MEFKDGKQTWTFALTDLPKSEQVVRSQFRGKSDQNIILKLLKQTRWKKVTSNTTNPTINPIYLELLQRNQIETDSEKVGSLELRRIRKNS